MTVSRVNCHKVIVRNREQERPLLPPANLKLCALSKPFLVTGVEPDGTFAHEVGLCSSLHHDRRMCQEPRKNFCV